MISYAELVESIVQDTKIGKKRVRKVLRSLRKNVFLYVTNGESVNLHGFCKVLAKEHPKDGYKFNGKFYKPKHKYRIYFSLNNAFRTRTLFTGNKKQEEQD